MARAKYLMTDLLLSLQLFLLNAGLRFFKMTEYLTHSQRVRGSSPRSPSNICKGLAGNGWAFLFEARFQRTH